MTQEIMIHAKKHHSKAGMRPRPPVRDRDQDRDLGIQDRDVQISFRDETEAETSNIRDKTRTFKNLLSVISTISLKISPQNSLFIVIQFMGSCYSWLANKVNS